MQCKKCKNEIPENSNFCNLCGANQNQKNKRKNKRGNGQGCVYKCNNGKYRVDVTLYYYMQNGKLKRKRKTKVFDKKVDAINAIPELKKQKDTTKVTLYDLYGLYVKSPNHKNLSKSQQDKLGYAWARLQPLHNKVISEITVDDLQNTIDDAVSTFYPARDMKVMLSHLYLIAIKREWCENNKSQYIELPHKGEVSKEPYNDKEIAAFWQDYNSGNVFTGYILIMIYGGLRFGELSTIKKANVFLDKQYMIGGIKTEAGINRDIAIADVLLPIVSYFYNVNKLKLLEIGESKFYKLYWETIDRLGLRKLPPRAGRRTYFTRMSTAGVPVGVITEAGGHTDYNTTKKNYVKIPLQDKIDAVNKI